MIVFMSFTRFTDDRRRGKLAVTDETTVTRRGTATVEKVGRYSPSGRRRGRSMMQLTVPLDELWRRDGGTCWICGEGCDRVDATRDHVVPWSRGGRDGWGNLRLAHGWCNQSRDDAELTAEELNRVRNLLLARQLWDLFDPSWSGVDVRPVYQATER